LRTLAATIKARWICEQAHQQFERGTRGLITSRDDPGKVFTVMRLMTMIAYALPPASPPRTSGAEKKKKKSTDLPPQPSLPAIRHAIVELIVSTTTSAMSVPAEDKSAKSKRRE